MSYGDLIYGSSGNLLHGADGNLLFSDAISPVQTHCFHAVTHADLSADMTEAEWIALQDDIRDALEADNSLQSYAPTGYTLNPQIYVYRRDFSGQVNDACYIATRTKFALPAGVRGNLTRMQARIMVGLGGTYFPGPIDDVVLAMTATASATAFADGAALLAAGGDFSLALGDWTTFGTEKRGELDVSLVNASDSDDFYLWTCMTFDNFPHAWGGSSGKLFHAIAYLSGMKIGLVC